MEKAYIYTANYYVKGDIEDLEHQNKIYEIFRSIDSDLSQLNVVPVLITSNDISKISNWGRCVNCGDMASNHREKECVFELSNGAIWNDEWYCDICLPREHKNSFYGNTYIPPNHNKDVIDI